MIFWVVLTWYHAYQRLDFWTDPEYKPRHIKTLVKLSKNSALFPDCLVLKGIEYEGFPAEGGGFGNVYKGRLGDLTIAVKVLKVYRKMDLDKLHKVSMIERLKFNSRDNLKF